MYTNKVKRILFIIAIPIAIIVVLLITSGEKDEDEAERKVDVNDQPIDPSLASSTEQEKGVTSSIYVDIKGEVKNPGVYEMDAEERVIDAIETAGGFTNNANESLVNLAQKVHDEMVIDVLPVGDNGTPALTNRQHTDTSKIRINQATVEEIEALNGIGPAKAEAIVQYRDENGHFQQIEDLLEVSGIGEKTLESLEDDIQVP
ncbi:MULTISPECIES: ComEA family DNA-binding protein [Virgibacillus]|uniref:ComEA family DNA-binding protein n=1 Tax=Virgibacillus dokdonensis TaxID=302167 RepID=A0ABU7VEJ0_9BACI|nr:MULTISPECIES: ComEA family DNA-binding protein [Virgibacillus]NWO13754.1 ComEA family DNA-binding protein [Virgibacillus sp.]